MDKMSVYTHSISLLSDQHSPAGVYSRLRLHFPETFLLESNEYHGTSSGRSIIGVSPIARFQVKNGMVKSSVDLDEKKSVKDQFRQFTEIFKYINQDPSLLKVNGIFGYTGYCAVQYFESISFRSEKYKEQSGYSDIPDMYYALYKYVLVFDHRNHVLMIHHNTFEKDNHQPAVFDPIKIILKEQLPEPYSFKTVGDEQSSLAESEYICIVEMMKQYISQGDVFQIVPSRRFNQKFSGDEFQVYRALRSINPSPYLFYFDCGYFRLFGSSPETALLVQNNEAILNPIAGSTKRSGNADKDDQAITNLFADPKEQSEHVMLVDLARNDLSRSCFPVKVDEYMKAYKYSHVIHLVSSVSGQLTKGKSAVDVFFETFPAGTVSGAPKYRAMQILDFVEPVARSFYSGAIGFFGADGGCVHALTIRSFLSKDSMLTYQAGAGVVDASQPQKELEEINIKLGALRAAIKMGASLHE